MRFNHLHIDKKLLMTADLMNTVNGGKSLPVLKMTRQEKNYLLTVKVPGVTAQELNAEVRDNNIYIIHKLTVFNSELYNNADFIPYLVGFIVVPYDVNIQGIHASFENNELHVILPFNELANGYYKKLSIDQQ